MLNKCRDAAKKAAFALGLHFAAMDMAVSYGDIYILESNTSPALTQGGEEETSTTAETYCTAIKRYLLGENI